jgi:hypothetical protein
MGIVRYIVLLLFFAVMITYSRVLLWASVRFGLIGIVITAAIVIGSGLLLVYICGDRRSPDRRRF